MAMHANLHLHNIVRIIVTKPYHLEGTNSNTNHVSFVCKNGRKFTVNVYSKTSDDFEVINLMDKKALGKEDVNHENS